MKYHCTSDDGIRYDLFSGNRGLWFFNDNSADDVAFIDDADE